MGLECWFWRLTKTNFSFPGSAGRWPADLGGSPRCLQRFALKITAAKDVAGKLPATAGEPPALPNPNKVREDETSSPALETSALPGNRSIRPVLLLFCFANILPL
jgi:hypothetical protein